MFEQYVNNPRVRAFLDVIAYCEGAGYNTLYGGGTFASFAQHPTPSGAHTAAGRYQFLFSTWRGLQSKYGFVDFSPMSQDLGAIALINERGALSNLVAGDLAGAIQKVKGVWPSLPGGSQQTRNWSQVSSVYAQGGAGSSSPAYTMPDGAGFDVTYLLWALAALVFIRVVRG